MPNSFKTTHFYLELINECPNFFWSIPKKNRTAAICKKALKTLGYSSACEAVKDNPSIFMILNPALFDHDTCLAFVTSDYFLDRIKNVPGQEKRASIHFDGTMEMDMNTIPLDKVLKYYDVCLKAVQANPEFLKCVPDDVITIELCEEAIRGDGRTFEYVPQKFRTQKMCELAFECDAWNLEKMLEQFKTQEMCLAAVKESGFLLKAVPEHLITHEMCMIAVADNNRGINDVPPHLFDKAVALAAINCPGQHAWRLLHEIPEQTRDYEVCLAAVKRCGSDLEYVPKSIISYELCLAAVKNSSSAAKFIPANMFTPEICLEMVKKSDDEFNLIPKECLTTELCLMAVKQGNEYDGTVIKSIPRSLLTQEVCDEAVKVSTLSFEGVPEEFVTEEMVMYVGKRAPYILMHNFPRRFQTQELFQKLVEINPSCEWMVEILQQNSKFIG